MGNYISSETEFNYIVTQLSNKLDNILNILSEIKNYIFIDTIKDEEDNNNININIIMKDIDADGFTWDDYEVNHIQ